MKTIAFVAAFAALTAAAVPASAQYYTPYNSGSLVGVQTGHVSVLNGGILNGGILSGNAVGNGILSGILNQNGLGLGLFNRSGKRW